MQPRQSGFTLIELVIAVAIVGILASFAISTYQSSVLKARRTDAKVTLTTLAQKQERHYTQNMEYADTLATLGAGTTSDEGYYTLALTGSATTFTLTATATGAQVKDTVCTSLSITHTGAESAVNDSGADTSSTCW